MMQPFCRIAAIVLVMIVWGHGVSVQAQSERHPLEPPDLSSPRATLTNFLALTDGAYQHWKTGGRTFQNRAQRGEFARLAHLFFDLNDIAPSLRNNVGREAAVNMKEVLDRIELPPWAEIPDAEMIEAKPRGLSRWTIPHTEITLVRLKEGPREGQWVFNSEMDDRAAEFYEKVKHRPYKPGASEGLYELFVSEPGWLIPPSWIHALPGWMHARPGGQAIWQWCALVLTLAVTAALMVLIYRIKGRWSMRQSGPAYYLAMVFPVTAVILPQWATDFLSDQVFITGRLFAILDFSLDLVSLGALVVVILGVTSRLATALLVVPWFQPGSVDAHLAQLIVRVIGVAAAVVAVFEGGLYLGVPLTTLVAGVSVGGLTVALAAQDGLKNLFGSLMILLDRPFQVGDEIRIKGHEGTVESVGLRSTRIREDSGHEVSISNEEMARLDSENISRRSHLLRREILRLRPDTPAERIRSFVEFLRGILERHEGFDPNHPPSVRLGISDDAVTVKITYWYHPPNSAAFTAFNERVTLRILEEMAQEGIQLAHAGVFAPGRELAPLKAAPKRQARGEASLEVDRESGSVRGDKPAHDR